jgi:hypothetical protein
MVAKLEIILVIVVTILVAPKPASAQADIDSGNFWLPYCKEALLKAGETSFRAGICAGEIKTLIWAASEPIGKSKASFCPPHGVTLNHAVQVVVHDFEEHPEVLHVEFLTLALVALHETWPCSGPRRVPE